MSPAATLVSVDEYLRTNYKPACEYRDGVLTQKAMSPRKHSLVQYVLPFLIVSRHAGFEAGPELTVRLRPDRFLVPDVGVQRLNNIQDPYPTEPIPLCVEVLSPDDRLSEALAKCEEYLAWGVPMVWIIDPERRTAWEFSKEGGLHKVAGCLTAGEISVSVEELFSVL